MRQRTTDSVWGQTNDSTRIERRHDTLYIERWHTSTQRIVTRDTVMVHDTVTLTQTETRDETLTIEVPRKLRWWQKALMWTGAAALAALLAGIALKVVSRKL